VCAEAHFCFLSVLSVRVWGEKKAVEQLAAGLCNCSTLTSLCLSSNKLFGTPGAKFLGALYMHIHTYIHTYVYVRVIHTHIHGHKH